MPSRERFITFRAAGAREERRKSEGFRMTVGSCADGTGAGAGAGAGVGVVIAAGVDGDVPMKSLIDVYGVGKRERPGPCGGTTTCAGLATMV